MRKIRKRALSCILVLSILLSSTWGMAFAETPLDDIKGHWAEPAIKNLSERDII